MSNHSQTIVPISTWCYCSPELGYKGYTIDIGLMAEALIYYDTVYVNITNQSQFATFIEWFTKQGKYNELLALVFDGTIQFYDYSFHTATVNKDGVMSTWNIVDPLQEKPNTFDQRFLYHKDVQAVLPTGRKRKHFYTAFRDRVIEVKAPEFETAIENARKDHREPRRNALILQAFVDEFAKKAGITPAFMSASDHHRRCRCNICLQWWAKMPDDKNEDGTVDYGPFTAEEVAAAREALKKKAQR